MYKREQHKPDGRQQLFYSRTPISAHLEVETYTWGVLPEPFRSGPVDAAVARELAWVLTELGA